MLVLSLFAKAFEVAATKVMEKAVEFAVKYIDTKLSGDPPKPLDVQVEQKHLRDESIQQRIQDAVEHRNGNDRVRMETMASEAALDFHRREGLDLQTVGGAGLVDAIGVDKSTGHLVCVEIKGTGLENKGFNQLGLFNEKRVENSPTWLDGQSNQLLERLGTKIEQAQDDGDRLKLTSIRDNLAELINEGGFEMNPQRYRSELFVNAREGAMNLASTEAHQTLGRWQKETGSTRVVLDEAPSSFVDTLLSNIGEDRDVALS